MNYNPALLDEFARCFVEAAVAALVQKAEGKITGKRHDEKDSAPAGEARGATEAGSV